MDFFEIKERSTQSGKVLEVYPDFVVGRSKDLMVRGGAFYAIWDDEKGLWSTDEYDVQRLVDQELRAHTPRAMGMYEVHTKYLSNFSSGSWKQFRQYMNNLSDSSNQLDETVTFADTPVRKEDYVSRRLPYSLRSGSIEAYDELISTLYDPSERRKLEWAIGAIIAGDARHIQKFVVLYGSAGSGKSTFINIIQRLFEGYYTAFEAKALTGTNNAFATETFRSNPLVAIQHDGDLSRIEDNTKLNSIVSHEDMTMNEKYKASYMARINAFLFMGTNRPVKITDAKSGIIRRLIDVKPSGRTLGSKHYFVLVNQIEFELGAIAKHCLDVYRDLGKHYYAGYRPVEMILQTDVFFNFIESQYDIFKEQDGTSLNQAYELYKQYCEDSLVEYKTPKYKFREELKNYFNHFDERIVIDGVRLRSWYSGFIRDRFTVNVEDPPALPLVLDSTDSIFDSMCADSPAQYATTSGIPKSKWDDPENPLETTLADIDTTQLHYVRPPLNHIVIDFDLKGEDGAKSAERNLEAASEWPSTYAEYSKGGAGIHLHYIYDGDPTELARVFSDGIEVKVFNGYSSLRRKLSYCNTVPVATLAGGLPLKEKKVITSEKLKSEKALRDLIARNLRKEIHPGTKPSIDFIHKILEDAYDSGLEYDVTDLRQRILAFANNSSNQAMYCIKLVQRMKFHSEKKPEGDIPENDARLVFFDCEVFPNLFVLNWKFKGDDNVNRMINPTAQEVESIAGYNLIGFNNRRYDNHILYAAMLGYSNEQLYKLSKKLLSKSLHGPFGEAYNLSYADVYDYLSKKQSLKKWEIELGLFHLELGLDWDQPVSEDLWPRVAEYCDNDVIALEAVFNARYQDFVARQILADLSGLSVNHTTSAHTARIIFGKERNPQSSFVYTNLAEQFPGYVFDKGVSTYKGVEVGEGGYVYAEPDMYTNVAVLDVASMHPTSIEQLNLFGEYTKNFSALKDARVAIKHGDYSKAGKMLGGALKPYLGDAKQASDLSYALKIVINIVYGLTAAKFDNIFRDVRNIDNIVAKRGALFMVDLQEFVQSKGFQVVHIKTDSIKIPNADQKIIDDVVEFGHNYGYDFEHETTYKKFCLVNNAVYIARKKDSTWDAVGAQFQHPFVFKTLFSKEPIEFEDLCETRSVTTALYLDFTQEEAMALVNPERELKFVGRVGSFVPILPGRGGGTLLREKEGKYYSAASSSKHFWLEADQVRTLGKEEDIDYSYFENLVWEAKTNIENYGSLKEFLHE